MKNALELKQFATFPVLDSLDTYVRRVNQIPLLTADEEHNYALQLRDHNDLDAARKLILSHLRFVVRVARGYQGYGLAVEDLIQEGNIGLMKAVKRFDPDMKVRLVSFAVHWIKAEIHEYVLRNWRIVKIATTKAQRKLFFNLRSMKKRLGWMHGDEVSSIAKELGVSTAEVMEMEERLNAHDVAFDLPGAEEEETAFAPVEYLVAEDTDPASIIEAADSNENQTEVLSKALATLDSRSLAVVKKRWLVAEKKKATLHDLAAEFKVSAERIRQIEENAVKKLKAVLTSPTRHSLMSC
jgi:RNA polymerase sigma-32 factor